MPSNEAAGSPDPRNPTHLPPRYEIRRLGPEHADWAASIVMHSNCYHSPVWPLVYPDNMNARIHACMKAGTYLVNHQIESGMSYGVFDTEYVYKRPESKATNGKLYWDEAEKDADGPTLLEQMDFPLVSVALAYDAHNALDMAQIVPLMEALPLFGEVYHMLDVVDKREKDSWSAKGHKEVLMRNATSTRHDYEGKGIMKKLAQWLMREAKLEGYRGINIEALHDAVSKVWLHPPAPFRGELVGEVDLYTYEKKGENGEVTYPFRPSKQVARKIYTHL